MNKLGMHREREMLPLQRSAPKWAPLYCAAFYRLGFQSEFFSNFRLGNVFWNGWDGFRLKWMCFFNLCNKIAWNVFLFCILCEFSKNCIFKWCIWDFKFAFFYVLNPIVFLWIFKWRILDFKFAFLCVKSNRVFMNFGELYREMSLWFENCICVFSQIVFLCFLELCI